jgi:hypothetical protein
MRIQTATISTKELQQALRDYCAANGGVPDRVVIESYESKISVELAPYGVISSDEFYHAVSGA